MYDVFYLGPKPGIFPHERPATTLDQAAEQSRTKFFWYINGQYDYSQFNFEFRAAPWQEQFIHVWPSQWQQHSHTYLANKYTVSDRSWCYQTDYSVRSQVDLALWHIPENISVDNFDFSWHPSALDPDYAFYFGTQWQSTGGPVYNPQGVAGLKIVNDLRAQALPNLKKWHIPENISLEDFDFSWHPNATDPDYAFYFGTQWQSTGGPVYNPMGQDGPKIVHDIVARALPNLKKWHIPENISVDDFDFSWHPALLEDKDFTYHFASQWQETSGVIYNPQGIGGM